MAASFRWVARRGASPGVAAAVAVVLTLVAPVRAQYAVKGKSAAAAAAAETLLRIPRPGTTGGMLTRICRTASPAVAPLVIINHGSPPVAAQRASRMPSLCGETARFFTSRGFAVAFPLRRGYGATGGVWVESYGSCEKADYARAGHATADDIAAALEHLLALPYIAKEPAIIIGQSAGGWGGLALASRNPDRVRTIINVAGGRGARLLPDGSYANCSPDALLAATASYGKGVSRPTLWIYAENDRLIGKELARRMHDAYVSGGGKARFELAPPFGSDGHTLFFGKGGSAIWGPLIERWLANPTVP